MVVMVVIIVIVGVIIVVVVAVVVGIKLLFMKFFLKSRNKLFLIKNQGKK